MKCNNYFLYLLVAIPSLLSCKKFVSVNPIPAGIINTNAIFTSDQTATSSVLGLYTKMRTAGNSMTNAGLSLYCNLSADDIYNTTTDPNLNQFSMNQLLSSNGILSTAFWKFSYNNIYQTNIILDGLNRSTYLTDSIRRQLTGEVEVVRALHYFYLVNLFGDVPLVLSTDYNNNASLARAASNSVYAQIVADLKDAQTRLKPAYPATLRSRPNLYVASALLSRVYLYMKDWSDAEASATSVISSAGYSLVSSSSINTTFTAASPETIWQVISDKGNTGEGAVFIPTSASARPAYALLPSLKNAFDSGDLRKVNWVKKNTVAGTDYFYPAKYQQRTIASGATPTEYDIVLRLSELYLIRAEARANQNNIHGAVDDLNIIRARAGVSLLNYSMTQGQLLAAVAHERQTELFAEWGHRWLDLKRTGATGSVLGPIKGSNWQSTDVLYPIPSSEILLDVTLTQNPGYQ